MLFCLSVHCLFAVFLSIKCCVCLLSFFIFIFFISIFFMSAVCLLSFCPVCVCRLSFHCVFVVLLSIVPFFHCVFVIFLSIVCLSPFFHCVFVVFRSIVCLLSFCPLCVCCLSAHFVFVVFLSIVSISVCPSTELLPGEPCGADSHGLCVNEHLCIDGYCSEYPTSPRSLTPSLSRNARSFPEYLEQLLKSPLCCFSVNSTNLCVYNDCPVWTACNNPT